MIELVWEMGPGGTEVPVIIRRSDAMGVLATIPILTEVDRQAIIDIVDELTSDPASGSRLG